jgi:hypothetical protein
MWQRSDGFAVGTFHVSKSKSTMTMVSSSLSSSLPTRTATTVTRLGGVGKHLWGGLFGSAASSDDDDDDTDNNNNNRSNPKTILDLATSSIKVRPLKFFLQLFLVGQQNSPSQGSWVLTTNDNDDNDNGDEGQTLDMYYRDGTGMFSIHVQQSGLKVLRHGQSPSLQYQLQESVLLHSLLDEVEGIAFDQDIQTDKRLLQFVQTDVLDKARGTLPARKAT